ncbi:MAG: hypothetical protein OEY89_17785 [Gammaproteobacteria bacterium]|nr:hypothetical protein [Gammaproteobacteria bacterium]
MNIKKQISLDQASVDMTLGDDVRDTYGHCLLSAGEVLTRTLLDSLQKRGITNIIIVLEQELSSEEITAYRETYVEKLEHRFRQQQLDMNMQSLKNIILDYRLDVFE